MNLSFDPRVEDDLADAASFYESRSSGLGEDFLAEVRWAVDQIVGAPERWPRVEGGAVRRYLLVRFPYAVFYNAGPDRVLILTVMHTRRHPDAWKQRVR
jgi:plasmid stabilization system protein ParE